MYGNRHRLFVQFMGATFWGTMTNTGILKDWAMINEKGEPRDLYICYGNMIRQLEGTTLRESIFNSGEFLYRFDGNGKTVFAAFTGDEVPAKTLYLHTDSRYTVLDMYGNIMAAGENGIPIGTQPVYIVFKRDPGTVSWDIGQI
jgi:hypothetical protein